MKTIYWFVLLCSFGLHAQGYVDLLKIGYSRTVQNNFEGSNAKTQVTAFELDANLPIPLNEKHTFVTGGTFGHNYLSLYPDAEGTPLYSTTLKLGMISTYNEKWSSTLVFLPKLASDYKNISSDDLYLGAFAVLKYHKDTYLIYRFGAYGSQEAFGFFTTPIFGWYYFSPSQRFEMDVSLPISVDINYKLGKITLGLDYFGIGRSFNLTGINDPMVYVDFSSLDFAAYIQKGFINNSVLLRGKIGYSSNDFEVYNQGDKIDLGLSAFSFGDDRTQINPSIQGGVFLKFELLYRFHLSNEKEIIEIID